MIIHERTYCVLLLIARQSVQTTRFKQVQRISASIIEREYQYIHSTHQQQQQPILSPAWRIQYVPCVHDIRVTPEPISQSRPRGEPARPIPPPQPRHRVRCPYVLNAALRVKIPDGARRRRVQDSRARDMSTRQGGGRSRETRGEAWEKHGENGRRMGGALCILEYTNWNPEQTTLNHTLTHSHTHTHRSTHTKLFILPSAD